MLISESHLRTIISRLLEGSLRSDSSNSSSNTFSDKSDNLEDSKGESHLENSSYLDKVDLNSINVPSGSEYVYPVLIVGGKDYRITSKPQAIRTDVSSTRNSKTGEVKKTKEGGSHRGIDIGCPTGTPLVAIADGKITASKYSESGGNYVQITHNNGVKSLYCHMVAPGAKSGIIVKKGDIIGISGSTGKVTGPHLHLGITPKGADKKSVDLKDYEGILNAPKVTANKKSSGSISEGSLRDSDQGSSRSYSSDSGDSQSSYTGPLVTDTGSKKYLGSPSEGISPSGFWSGFRSKLENHINSIYPEIGLRVENLGVTRDLSSAADKGSNSARVSGSKHGAGLAQDCYFHTKKYGEYKSFKTMNPILAKDQNFVDAIIDFIETNSEYKDKIIWGGSFGHSGKSSLSKGETPVGRGELELHHFEFKSNIMPKFFESYEEELKKLGIKSSDLTSTKALADLYKKLL